MLMEKQLKVKIIYKKSLMVLIKANVSYITKVDKENVPHWRSTKNVKLCQRGGEKHGGEKHGK
jgi:hypothetical protein